MSNRKAKQIRETAEGIIYLSIDLIIVAYIFMDAFNLWKFL